VASNNKTPAQVLAAPPLQPKYIHENFGMSRRQRRHFIDPETGKRSFIKIQPIATNKPYCA
jgi:hypothetical protein